MTSIFTPDPFVYVFDDDYCWRNLRYGPHPDHRLNVYLNPTRMSGGNGLLIVAHSGEFTAYEKHRQVETSFRTPPWWLVRYCLNSGPSIYDLNTHFDVISVEYPAYSHLESNSASYEPVSLAGVGAQSYRGYGQGFIDDIMRAWQWCADNANDSRWTWNTNKFIATGYGYGSYASMVAALQGTRAYDVSGQGGRWIAKSPARVRGVINYSGEVSVSPWVNHHSITRYLFGLAGAADASATNIRSQMERLLLNSTSTGTYPSTTTTNALCRSLSPVDLADVASADKKAILFRSYYNAQASVTTPVTADYSGVPPYGDGGFNNNQRGLLDTALINNGFLHTPTDSSWLYDAGVGGVNIQSAVEATLVSTFAWMESAVS